MEQKVHFLLFPTCFTAFPSLLTPSETQKQVFSALIYIYITDQKGPGAATWLTRATSQDPQCWEQNRFFYFSHFLPSNSFSSRSVNCHRNGFSVQTQGFVVAPPLNCSTVGQLNIQYGSPQYLIRDNWHFPWIWKQPFPLYLYMTI